jgi:hypothetical protein
MKVIIYEYFDGKCTAFLSALKGGVSSLEFL